MTRTYNTLAKDGKGPPAERRYSRPVNAATRRGNRGEGGLLSFDSRGTRPLWRHGALRYWLAQGTPLHVAKVFAHLTSLSDEEALALASSRWDAPKLQEDADL